MTNARSLGNTRLSMLAAPRALSSRAEFVADIRREWTNALEATVQVGRRLNEAKAALPHGEYEAMIESELPFSPATARKLREVASFVDAGKVPLDQLPEAYSTLYAIATLPEEVREEAVAQGVIRPDVTRAEVEAFKEAKAVTKSAPPTDDGVDGDLFAPASPTAQASPLTVFGCVAAARWVQVPDQLLIRLDAALHERGLIGPDDITLHYPVSGDRVQLRRYDDGAYRIAAHDINGMVYVGSCMSATKLADFLRDWLALDLFAPASPAAAPPPPTPRVIDVEPEVTDSAPPMNRLAAPASAVPASRFSAALGLRWHPDPTDPGAITVELEGQRRVLFVMVAHDPAAAALVRHVLTLHNARLGG